MRNIGIILLIFSYLLFFSVNANAKGTAGNAATYETRYIVDMPTAGMLSDLRYSVLTGVMGHGGAILQFTVAPFDFVNIGAAMSADGLIGDNDPVWQDYPGFEIKFRLIDEKKSFPALALGFSSQGRGAYIPSSKTFEIPSPGFFLAASKNYVWSLGQLAFHAGVNYSVEIDGNDRAPNFYLGWEQSIGKYFAVNLEWNSFSGDKTKDFNGGILNSSFRFSASDNVTIELQFKDFTKQISERIPRFLYIDIIGSLR